MIDLHLHTKYSDGTDSVIELLKKADNIGLNFISITDHDNIDAYLELENIDSKDYFSGDIIIGAEFKTFYNGVSFEILGYNLDLDYIKKLSYLRTRTSARQMGFLAKFKEIGREIGLIFDENIELNERHLFASDRFAAEILSHKENKDILEKYNIPFDAQAFYRYAQTNPQNIFYMDETKTFPKPEEIVRDIHAAGGLAFIAHPYVYSFEDRVSTCIQIVKTYGLDGIECYYNKVNEEEQKALLEYCKKSDKYISGGSDYHGFVKPDVEIGCANVPIDIIDWYKKKD